MTENVSDPKYKKPWYRNSQRYSLLLLVLVLTISFNACKKRGFDFNAKLDSLELGTDTNSSNGTDPSPDRGPDSSGPQVFSFSEGVCKKAPLTLFNNTWENTAVFDPLIGEVVHTGGHVINSYVQNSYAQLYNPETLTGRKAKLKRTGPRQCLVDGIFIDSIGKTGLVHGNTAHGSMSPGGFFNNYTKLGLADPIGTPWFYDGIKEDMEFARPLGTEYDRKHHSSVTYDASSDAMVSLGDDKLLLYNARTNKVILRDLPVELHKRYFYGIAADPVHRKIVVFGGSGPKIWYGVLGDRQTNYDLYAMNDTWIYDTALNSWKKVNPQLQPPKGNPGIDFVKFSMVYEPGSGHVLLRVNPLSIYVQDRNAWPDAETWAFSVATEQWTKIVLKDGPAFPGLMVYDSIHKKLAIVGGGRDSKATNVRPALSQEFYTCSVPKLISTSGAPLQFKSTPDPAIVNKNVLSIGSVQLSWTPQSSTEYFVYRAEANPFPGVFELIGKTKSGEYVDSGLTANKIYAYQVAANGQPVRAQPVFNQPMHPWDLSVSVESLHQVKLAWQASKEEDVVGYNVYRAKGANKNGPGEKLNTALLTQTSFTDSLVDLTDKVAHFYWVKAVNKGGIESGASAWMTTMPEAPHSLVATKDTPNTIKISWQWPAGIKVAGFRVFHVLDHMNANDKTPEVIYAWYNSWTSLTPMPIVGNEITFTIPPESNLPGRHHYFYIRAVNILDQNGFYSDIVSATDKAFVSQSLQP